MKDQEDRDAKRLKAALAAHAGGDLAAAEAGYRSILARRPRHADALNLLGVLLHAKGQFGEAEGLIAMASRLLPASADILSNLAMVQLSAGIPEQAAIAAERALSLASGHPQAGYFRAQACEQTGRTQEAVQTYRDLVAARPTWLPPRQALYRLVEPESRDIHALGQMAWLQPAVAAWRNALGMAIEAKIAPLMQRENFAQADILRLMAAEMGLAGTDGGASLRGAIAHGLRIGRGLPEVDKAGRFLLIRSWGCGFWSDVNHVLGQLLLAEIVCRTPVVHWGENSLYGGSRSDDGFAYFFEPIGAERAKDLPWSEGSVYPGKWDAGNATGPDIDQWEGEFSRQSALNFLNRTETIVVSDFYTQLRQIAAWIPEWHPICGNSLDDIYRYLTGKYLRPRAEVLEAVDRFIAERFAGSPYLALHLRGLDKISECDRLAEENSDLMARADRVLLERPDLMAFVLTDDGKLLASARERYGDRLVVSECTRATGEQGIHFLAAKEGRRALGAEVMQDALIASRAACFIGLGSSNVAAMVSRLGTWESGALTLNGRSQQEQFNLMLNDW